MTVTASPAASQETAPPPQTARLVGDVFLVVWELARPALSAPKLSAPRGVSVAPCASLRLMMIDGTTRVLMAFRYKSSAPARLRLSAAVVGPDVEIDFDPELVSDRPDHALLARDLQSSARQALVRALVATWPSLYRIDRSTAYARRVDGILSEMAGHPAPARILATAAGGALLH